MANIEKDPFAGFPDLQRRLEDSLRAYAQIGERLRESFLDLGADLSKVTKQFVINNEALLRSITPITQQFAEFGRRVVELARLSDALDRSGWLPHPSMPMHLLAQHADEPKHLSKEIERYYRDNWPEIRKALDARVRFYDLDQEAKDSFEEALAAHELGLYRAVCRHLFPEIERVVRLELHNDNLDKITSQKDLRTLAGRLPLGLQEPHGFFVLKLFERLSGHLYVNVNDETKRRLLENDAVPNRHAAVHGLVVYRTSMNSLNTIFMTDYVFQIVHLAKQLASRKN